jgi:hypothetical protein
VQAYLFEKSAIAIESSFGRNLPGNTIDGSLSSVQLYEARNLVSVMPTISLAPSSSSVHFKGVTSSSNDPSGGAGGVWMGPCNGVEPEDPRHGRRPPR